MAMPKQPVQEGEEELPVVPVCPHHHLAEYPTNNYTQHLHGVSETDEECG